MLQKLVRFDEGSLKSVFEKDGKTLERKLNPDRSYISKDNKKEKLHEKFTFNQKCWSSRLIQQLY